MTEATPEGRPTRGRRSAQLQEELDAAAAIEATEQQEMGDGAGGAIEEVGQVVVLRTDRLFVKASIPYKLHGGNEDASYFTTSFEAVIGQDDDLDEVFAEVRDIVLKTNASTAAQAQAMVDEIAEANRRRPIRPRG